MMHCLKIRCLALFRRLLMITVAAAVTSSAALAAPAPALKDLRGQVPRSMILPAPEVPAGFEASAKSPGSIRTSWKSVAGATYYQVWRAPAATGPYARIKTTAYRSFTDEGLPPGSTWYYKVRAYTKDGTTNIYGKFSAVRSAKASPAVPNGFRLKTAASSMNMSWDPVPGATYYQVWRAPAGTGPFTRIKTTAYRSFVDEGLTPGTRWYYKVRAYTKVGDVNIYGRFSPVLTDRVRPGMPQDLSWKTRPEGIALTWSKVEGSSYYQIWRAQAPAGPYAHIKTTAYLAFTDTAPPADGAWYKVRAYKNFDGIKVYGDFTAAVRAEAPIHRPMITWVDDDGNAGFYAKLKPFVLKYSIPFTSAIITSRSFGGRYMTLAEMNEMAALGCEFVSHTHTHDVNYKLTDMTEADLRRDLLTSREIMRDLGFNASIAVYPFGAENEFVHRVTSEYYDAAIDVFNSSSPFGDVVRAGFDPYRIERVSAQAADINGIFRKMDEAARNNSWIILMSHVDQGSWYSEERVTRLIDYALAAGLEFVTLNEGFTNFRQYAEYSP